MSNPVVDTSDGPLAGRFSEDGIAEYFGIPYAAPPVGALRWRAPQPVDSWTEVRQATSFGKISPQIVAMGASLVPGDDTDADEDCLTLNVWAPSADEGERRPVLVWIHGGAFIGGAGSSQLYRGNHLVARGDVVVVTINYRLGALGFLAHPALDDDGYAGNWGLLDQIAALEWVQQNIASFGGDPDNVTVFGESAGAMSIGNLLAAVGNRALFHRAILQSGQPLALSKEVGERIAERFFAECGVDIGDADALRAVPVEEILRAQQAVSLAEFGRTVMPFQPVIDGGLLERHPVEQIAEGSAKGIPMLIGTNLDEMKFFGLMDAELRDMDEARLRKRLHANIKPEECDSVVDAYIAARSSRGETTKASELWSAIESDRFFRLPALRLADAHQPFEPHTYTYLFTWPSPAAGGALGSCHALELGFVFGTLRTGAVSLFTGNGPEAIALSERMMDAWLSFARTSDPGWERHNTETRPTMVFDAESRLEHDPLGAERAAWSADR